MFCVTASHFLRLLLRLYDQQPHLVCWRSGSHASRIDFAETAFRPFSCELVAIESLTPQQPCPPGPTDSLAPPTDCCSAWCRSSWVFCFVLFVFFITGSDYPSLVVQGGSFVNTHTLPHSLRGCQTTQALCSLWSPLPSG